MSGDGYGGGALIVSGGGATTVLTDELEALASDVAMTSRSADEWIATVGAVLWLVGRDGGGHLGAAHRIASAVAEDAHELALGLRLAGEAYGATERAVTTAQEGAAGVIGWLAGFFGRFAAPALAAAGAVAGMEGALALYAFNGVRRLLGEPPLSASTMLLANRRLYTNPLAAGAIRLLVSSVDEAEAGAVGLPLPVARALSDSAVVGVPTSAFGVLVGAGMFGAMRDGWPVAVRQVSSTGAALHPAEAPLGGARTAGGTLTRGAPVSSPTGVADLFDRVPSPSDDRPQVRIDRFGGDDDPSWAVYIGGTASWDLTAGEQPWDLTSDVEAVAGRPSGSYDAVVQALQAAGVEAGDPVIAVGHSQGGVLAAQLASDDRFSVTGIVTAGAPIASADVPASVAVLQVEHSDDVVPSLAGVSAADSSPEHLLLRREFLSGANDDATGFVPAHDLAGYRQTAGLIDDSHDSRVTALRREVLAGITASDGEATWWVGQRTTSGGRE